MATRTETRNLDTFWGVLRSENLQTIREYKSLKKPEFSQIATKKSNKVTLI